MNTLRTTNVFTNSGSHRNGKITAPGYMWVPILQTAQAEPQRNIILYVNSSDVSGRIGFFYNRMITGALTDSGLTGLAALHLLLSAKDGTYFIEAGQNAEAALEQSLAIDMQQMLDLHDIRSKDTPAKAFFKMSGSEALLPYAAETMLQPAPQVKKRSEDKVVSRPAIATHSKLRACKTDDKPSLDKTSVGALHCNVPTPARSNQQLQIGIVIALSVALLTVIISMTQKSTPAQPIEPPKAALAKPAKPAGLTTYTRRRTHYGPDLNAVFPRLHYGEYAPSDAALTRRNTATASNAK